MDAAARAWPETPAASAIVICATAAWVSAANTCSAESSAGPSP
jgi:hypothetical protein